MVQETQLSEVLSEFARTLATDFPIHKILDHLVARIVDLLPITAAGVTLIAPGRPPRYIAASDDDALSFERLQTALDEGPCLAAYRSGTAVSVPDLANDDRVTRFGPPRPPPASPPCSPFRCATAAARWGRSTCIATPRAS